MVDPEIRLAVGNSIMDGDSIQGTVATLRHIRVAFSSAKFTLRLAKFSELAKI